MRTLGSSRRTGRKQFEIWWAELQEPAGRRPVLLLSRNDAHDYLFEVVAEEVAFEHSRMLAKLRWAKRRGCLNLVFPILTISGWC